MALQALTNHDSLQNVSNAHRNPKPRFTEHSGMQGAACALLTELCDDPPSGLAALAEDEASVESLLQLPCPNPNPNL